MSDRALFPQILRLRAGCHRQNTGQGAWAKASDATIFACVPPPQGFWVFAQAENSGCRHDKPSKSHASILPDTHDNTDMSPSSGHVEPFPHEALALADTYLSRSPVKERSEINWPQKATSYATHPGSLKKNRMRNRMGLRVCRNPGICDRMLFGSICSA